MSFRRGGATADNEGARSSCEKTQLVHAVRGSLRSRSGRLWVEQGQGLLASVVDGRTRPWPASGVIGEGVSKKESEE